eukprot:687648-Hanusia_phi.AAC.2
MQGAARRICWRVCKGGTSERASYLSGSLRRHVYRKNSRLQVGSFGQGKRTDEAGDGSDVIIRQLTVPNKLYCQLDQRHFIRVYLTCTSRIQMREAPSANSEQCSFCTSRTVMLKAISEL